MKKSYIVFGAGGSIGSAIVGHLRGGGHWVVSSPRKKNDQPGAVPENYSQGVIKVMEDVSRYTAAYNALMWAADNKIIVKNLAGDYELSNLLQ